MSSGDATIDRSLSWRAITVLGLITAALTGLVGRLFQIHLKLAVPLTSLITEQHHGTTLLPAQRGMILDARGRVAAASRPMPDVFVDPSRVEDVDHLVEELSARLNLPASDLRDKIQRRREARFVTVAHCVDEATAEAVRALKHPAVGLSDRSVRVYPLASSMAHVLGHVGREEKGLEGLELTYDSHLRGRDGKRQTVRDARRRSIWPGKDEPQLPVDGGHVVLTIDAEVQRVIEDALADAVRTFEAEGGVAIVMSPKTGDILGMACHPSFDANAASRQPAHLRRNRAITDPVEPGSTFKPFVACGALDGGFVTREQQIDCHMGSWTVGSRIVRDTSPHGMMDIAGIIVHSSNIGMAMIGQRMGNKAMHETVRRFGFGRKTGIECPGEGSGIVYGLKQWNSFSTVSVPMGYEVSVTPIQLITGFCALLNDGVLLRPRVVSRLLGPDGETVESFDEPQVVGTAASADVARYFSCELLTSVVEEGTGKRAQVGGYRVLGKTGTPKLAYRDRRGYEPGAYQPMFVGAAPADDPRIAVLVAVTRPDASKEYYGGKVAAPVAARIFREALPYLGVAPDSTTEQHAGF